MATVLPLSRFKALVKQHRSLPAAPLVRKQMPTSIEPLDERCIRFTISTGGVDRSMDTVAVDGWDLTAYRQNPVVLWAHDADQYPVGRVIEIGTEGDSLKATVEFVPLSIPCAGERAEAVLQLLKAGFLNATSVGFRPLEFAMTDDPERGATDWLPGIDFRSQELLELSIVTVPCNSDALIEPGQQAFDGVTDIGPNETVSPDAGGLEERAEAASVRKRGRVERQRAARRLSIPR